ncbi:MAG: ABC transporter ATP-binding protein [Chloroflexi bacterium]|nr:ABC transporter ATP-binding protein [Chloroflexota bacterium]
MPDKRQPVVELVHLSRTFEQRGMLVKAVDDVTLAVNEGEVVCLVGESGCGKTTTGKMIAGLIRPSGGEIRYNGQDIWRMDAAQFRKYRMAVQLIHQDPYASLNPAHSVFRILSAPLLEHKIASNPQAARDRVRELLMMVDLTPPDDFLDKYPHQLSGGQRQRVSVARALTVVPSVIVADEAVSMVDVSIRVSLLNTLRKLKERLGVTYVFITHDLAVAKHFAWEGRVAVMYLGRMVEVAHTPQLVNHPQHPYTQALLSAIPEPDPRITRTKERVQLRSLDVPSLLNLPPGCSFHPRCPRFEAGLCDVMVPELMEVGTATRVACHVVTREAAHALRDGHTTSLPPAAP